MLTDHPRNTAPSYDGRPLQVKENAPGKPRVIHPLWLRVTHWINALAVVLLATSGWRIYNASPVFDFSLPASLTIGGWLGGALQWHFFAMWLLLINGIVYLTVNVVSGRLRKRFSLFHPVPCWLTWPLRSRAS